MAREPVRGHAFVLLPVLLVAEIEDLDLDTAARELAGLKVGERRLRAPEEHAGVARVGRVAPFDHHLEVAVRVLGPRSADGLAGADDHAVLLAPGGVVPVDVHEVVEGELGPARAVDEGARQVGRGAGGQGLGARRGDEEGEGRKGGKCRGGAGKAHRPIMPPAAVLREPLIRPPTEARRGTPGASAAHPAGSTLPEPLANGGRAQETHGGAPRGPDEGRRKDSAAGPDLPGGGIRQGSERPLSPRGTQRPRELECAGLTGPSQDPVRAGCCRACGRVAPRAWSRGARGHGSDACLRPTESSTPRAD